MTELWSLKFKTAPSLSLIKLFSDGKIKQETNDEERERERERKSKNRKIFEIDKKVTSF